MSSTTIAARRQICSGDCLCRECSPLEFLLPPTWTKGFFSVKAMSQIERPLHTPLLDGVYVGQATDWLVGTDGWVDVLPENTEGQKHVCRCGVFDICRRRLFGTVECRWR